MRKFMFYLITSGTLLILMFCNLTFSSYGQNAKEKNFYQDSVFLKIEGDLNGDWTIRANEETYLRALYRMRQHIHVKHHRLIYDIMNGESIKISENIYDYFTQMIKSNNELLDKGTHKIVRHLKEKYYFIVPKNMSRSEVLKLRGKEK